MTIASLTVPLVDGIAKVLSVGMSPFSVAFGRYVVASLIVLPIAAFFAGGLGCQNGHSVTLNRSFMINVARTAFIAGAMTCFYFAIRDIPLATAFGGYFLGPVLAAAVAAPVLGERLTLLKLVATIVGLIGACLIVQPSIDFKPGTLLAILSGALFGGYLVTTRLAVSETSALAALRFQCLLGALLLLPFALANWSWPTGQEFLLIAIMGVVSACCNFLVIAAFRFGEVMVLSPLSYLELTTATLLGILVFSELPDASSAAGIGLVVGSGLLIWFNEWTRAAQLQTVEEPARRE
jgi:drug/metabolite transporter (DMT)-like permease